MSKPIKQHYIPKSYLKNFAQCKGKGKKEKCSVDIYLKREEIIRQNIPISSICYQKHLYTLQNKDEAKKYDLELYYANNVDSEFQKIYRLLIDKKKGILSKEEKLKVLYVCLSFYFRTPIHLNQSNSFNDQIFKRLKLYADDSGMIKTTMFGGKEIHIDELDKIQKKTEEERKTRFHIEHLEKWIEFVQHKYECTINVIEIQDKEAYLITSDNPVIIREINSNRFEGLFNPNNVITLPLDPKHFLEIHPNTVANDDYQIRRFTHNKDFVFTTNAMTEQNATDILIGFKDTLDYHFETQNQYEQSELGQKTFDKMKFKLDNMKAFLELVEKHGPKSKEAIAKLKEIQSNSAFKSDKQVKELIEKYKKLNLL